MERRKPYNTMIISKTELELNATNNTITDYKGESVDAQSTNAKGEVFDYIEETIEPTNDFDLVDVDAMAEFFTSVLVADGLAVIRAGSQRRMIQPSEPRQDAFKAWCEQYNVSIELMQCILQSVLANATSQTRTKTLEDYKADILRIEEAIAETKKLIPNAVLRAQIIKDLDRSLKVAKTNFDKARTAAAKA